MKNQTQRQIVLEQLTTKGSITRNWCLMRYISRLGAIICDLKMDGYDIQGEHLKTSCGYDYIYKLTARQQNLF